MRVVSVVTRHLLFGVLAVLASASSCGDDGSRSGPDASGPGDEELPSGTARVKVDITPGHETNTFSPVRAMGAGIDRDPLNSVKTLYRSPDLEKMLSAGWGSVSYRLNTELGASAWHWNPSGAWSDPRGAGYFVGAPGGKTGIERSFGYYLPHNGMTQSFIGFGVLDDGKTETYWKSNPYLSSHYTHESDTLHPQWVVVDLGKPSPVDGIEISWGDPYAVRYEVQRWIGGDAINDPAHGSWQSFPLGSITSGAGGDVTLKLGGAAVKAQFLRVSMTASSGTCDSHGASDPRNCMGYAIRELYAGTLDSKGKVSDLLHHAPDGSQTTTYASSADPWHQPSDIDTSDGEQPGFDLVYESGITRALPMTVPVAMLYDNPDNAASEIAYLKAHRNPIRYVELGEEPDGQYVLPEDDAALFIQWADAIHAVDPSVELAGPVFQGVNDDIPTWPDGSGETSWFTRFLNYLRAHGHIDDLRVMTFEHYPYNPCSSWSLLYDEPALLSHVMKVWRDDGLPATVPMQITESNLSWNANTENMTTFAALWLADYMGAFLTAGGQAAYLYQYEPIPMYEGCGWGTFGMFDADGQYRVRQEVAQYFAARMLTQEWAQPVDQPHALFPATADVVDAKGHVLVTTYAVRRPDGQWSLLAVNKDPDHEHTVAVAFHDASGGGNRYFQAPVAQTTFGDAEYQWHENGARGSASPDGPASESMQPGGRTSVYSLPKASVTVLRGHVR